MRQEGSQMFYVPSGLNFFTNKYLCIEAKIKHDLCRNGKVPRDFVVFFYNGYFVSHNFSVDLIDAIRLPLEDYAKCTIEHSGKSFPCNMDVVTGPFYSTDEMPQFCYTLYSLWGKPNETRHKIPKHSTIKLQFNLNTSNRYAPDKDGLWTPKYLIPSDPVIQMSIHSPYFLPSPYGEGLEFLGGKHYEVRVNMKETKLLPPPYQTNCTDYMTPWKENGGMGPINQLGVVEKCRMQFFYDLFGCVPLKIDYPHLLPLCGEDCVGCKKFTEYDVSECTDLSDSYNQPCKSITYSSTKEEVPFYVENLVNDSDILKDVAEIRDDMLQSKTEESLEEDIDKVISILNHSKIVRKKIKEYDCSKEKIWTPDCSKISVEILFDRFEITKYTYKAKIEEVELFSIIGGYMGAWLGISLVAIYKLLENGVKLLLEKRKRVTQKLKQKF